MGFCMLENPDRSCGWVAVNPAYVESVQADQHDGYDGAVTRLNFVSGVNTQDISCLVKGSPQDIENIFKKAARIGMGKALVQLLGSRNAKMPTPIQMGHTNRIVLIRELLPEEFPPSRAEIVTCSLIIFEDNTRRCVMSRPGMIARKVNAQGKVPTFPDSFS